MFKLLISFLLLFSAVAFSGCTRVNSSELREVSFDDNNSKTSNEVVITDADINRGFLNGDKSEQIQILADNSQVLTMFDGYGNKIEKRYFKGHGRLELVMIRTAIDGSKQIFVYGFGTDIVTMPNDFAEKALNASADEIVETAKLKTPRPFKPSFPVATPKPLPTPARTTVIESLPQVKAEETPKPEVQTSDTTQTTETETPVKENPQPKEENKP